MKLPYLAPALGVALLLSRAALCACGSPPEPKAGCTTAFGSVGPLISFAFGERKSFGIGGEVSVNYIPDNSEPIGYGGYLNDVHYFTRSSYDRLSAGAQANRYALGGELGFGFLSGSSGAVDSPPLAGAIAGGFTEVPLPIPAGPRQGNDLPYMPLMLLIAFRVTFPVTRAPQYSLDFGLKVPIGLSRPGFYFH
jgi:hypothetical protein